MFRFDRRLLDRQIFLKTWKGKPHIIEAFAISNLGENFMTISNQKLLKLSQFHGKIELL